MQQDMFSNGIAMALRDQALDQVAENSQPWMERAIGFVSHMPVHGMTGEEIRRIVSICIGEPHHHNAWGALISTAIKRKHFWPTGEYRKMTSKKSHARRTPVYENNKWYPSEA